MKWAVAAVVIVALTWAVADLNRTLTRALRLPEDDHA